MLLQNQSYEVMTPSGWQSFDGVKISKESTIKIRFSDGNEIKTTENHIFISDMGNEILAKDSFGKSVKTKNGTSIVSEIVKNGIESVYDLINVAGGNLYYTNDIVSHNCLVLDEFAHMRPNLATEFIASVFPTLSSSETSQMIIVSTPKGMNHYYKLWTEAEQGLNGFTPISGHWSEHPKRNQAWADAQLAELGDVLYQQEVECSFIGSSNTLIKGEKVASLPLKQPLITSPDGFTCYSAPVPKRSYVMTVDVAKGEEQDSSAFVIFDITEFPYKIVGTYKNNKISTLTYPDIVYHYAKMYNEAFVLVESNSLGQQVADALFYDLEYENMYMSEKSNRDDIKDGFGGRMRPGVETTKKSKLIGCNAIKLIVEQDHLEVNSADVISEMSTFVRTGTTWKAEEGKHDDLMMCLVTFGFLTQTTTFKNLFDFSLRNQLIKRQLAEIESEELPMGYFFDGTEDEFEIPMNL